MGSTFTGQIGKIAKTQNRKGTESQRHRIVKTQNRENRKKFHGEGKQEE